ncbi:hypothetical protein ACWIGY_14550 [Streptomyces anulatus]
MRTILTEADSAELVEFTSSDEVTCLPGFHAITAEHNFTLETGAEFQVASFYLEESEFETRGLLDFEEFCQWIEKLADTLNLTAAFIPGGSDASSFGRNDWDSDLKSFVSDLAEQRRFSFAHAFIYLPNTLTALVARIPEEPAFYRSIHRESKGIILSFVDLHPDGTFELLEPGPLEGEILQSVNGAPHQSR